MGVFNALGNMGKNIHAVGKGGEYIASAIKGAAIWGGVSGVTEWASGGSFFQGVKGGLVTGAIGGAGIRAAKVGFAGKAWETSTWGDIGRELTQHSDRGSNALKTLIGANKGAAFTSKTMGHG